MRILIRIVEVKMIKRIAVKISCLVFLFLGCFFLAGDNKVEATSCNLICPEGTVCQGFGDNATCVCVCFDEYGNCTYSWSYCPYGNPNV